MLSEALLIISGSVRNTATLLEVLVATKISAHLELDFVAVESGCALQDCRVEASREARHSEANYGLAARHCSE